MLKALFVVLLAGNLFSQQLPSLPLTNLGIIFNTQVGSGNPDQDCISVVSTWAAPATSGVGFQARLGTSVYAIGTKQGTSSDYMRFFSVVWSSPVAHPIWFAEQGFNQVWGVPTHLFPPAFEVTYSGASPWSNCPGVIQPTLSSASVLEIHLPFTQSLVGLPVSIQSWRYDGKWWISDELMFVLG